MIDNLFAVTTTSYRAISSVEQLAIGEELTTAVPIHVLFAAREYEVRSLRSKILRATDWAQSDDSPLSSIEKQEWAVYRQALRDLPEQDMFPECVWPTPPNLREGAAGEVSVK